MARGAVPADFTEAVARRLSQLRIGRGLTLAGLARRMKLHENSVRNHESGVYAHTAYQLECYAKFYRVPVSTFLEDC